MFNITTPLTKTFFTSKFLTLGDIKDISTYLLDIKIGDLYEGESKRKKENASKINASKEFIFNKCKECLDDSSSFDDLNIYEKNYVVLSIYVSSVNDKIEITETCEKCGTAVNSSIPLNSVIDLYNKKADDVKKKINEVLNVGDIAVKFKIPKNYNIVSPQYSQWISSIEVSKGIGNDKVISKIFETDEDITDLLYNNRDYPYKITSQIIKKITEELITFSLLVEYEKKTTCTNTECHHRETNTYSIPDILVFFEIA